ncbi:unnamed protein product [Adineta steineri]|uniref:Aminopeptidase N-like N-terminal domain-containing protein n=1 Tax=Adineta steineri TaxID=433720 RepID=A0A814WBY8_9BILA|nr:unnamed protein product [Adineta steineri]CAF1470745.1 unnamed protein product [Adineta steineri]
MSDQDTKKLFDREVIIHIQVKEPTDTIILYAAELQIDNAKIISNTKDELNGTIETDEENERLKITFNKTLKKNDYQLSMKFIDDINNRMVGFYRNQYTTPDGNVRYSASTQFEPADCRRAFPCWDEPNFEATFDITLITPKNLQAISNMPIVSESEYAENKEWKV